MDDDNPQQFQPTQIQNNGGGSDRCSGYQQLGQMWVMLTPTHMDVFLSLELTVGVQWLLQ